MQPDHLTDALVRKLTRENRLDAEDITAVQALPFTRQELKPGTAIAREGDRPERCCLIVDGFLYRAKTTEDGKRQILSFHVPGDIPDLQSLHLQVSDHDLCALSSATVGFIPHRALHEVTWARPNIAAALWRETLIDAALFRDGIVNVARRPAPVRLAHLLSELARRLALVGRTDGIRVHLPLTQVDLADALGLTSVHVNRTLQTLRARGILEFRNHVLTYPDSTQLETLGRFDPLYLHANPNL